MRHYGVGRTASAGGEEQIAKQAAAAANFLNGHAPHPGHEGLDLPQVQAARDWIRKNIEMRELVVQTLRVTAIVHPSASTKMMQ